MRLQPEGLPDAMHRRGRVADLLSHRPQAPVRRSLRKCLQRLADRGCNLIVTDLARRTRARLVVKTFQPLRRKAIAPRTHRCRTDTDLGGDLLVVEPLSRSQNDPRPFR
jgi:hypothetical protein